MKKSIYAFMLYALVVTLSSCGGGGSDSSPTVPNGFNVVLTPLVSSLPSNTLNYPGFLGSPFITQLEVRVTFSNGAIAPDGTTVNLTTSNASVAHILETDDLNASFQTLNTPTTGGVANFFIASLNQGSASFTASASTGGRSYTGNLTFQVTAGPDPTFEQVAVVAPRNTLPVNDLNTPFFLGTPFMMEADIQFRDVFGNFTNPVGTDDDASVQVSVNPVSIVYFTTLDDTETEDINEFLLPLGQGRVDMNSGHGNLFLWSREVPGNATVSVSATEAGSGRELTTTFNIEVVDGSTDTPFPSDVSISSSGGSLYINGSGGSTSESLSVNVTSGNLPVDDPQVNNVQLTMITDGGNSGERLSGINVNGTSVNGTSINVATVNGLVNALVNSGTNTNTITVTATVDGADNNVDNGIQEPISANASFIVSDGVLWGLEITNSVLDTLTVNGDTTGGQDGEEIVYNYQDGTYSFTLSASATDKQGNPALPQTVQFGMINSPISGYPLEGSGYFDISGLNGDPQEGGSSFTSNNANFLTDAGGVQISDTLLVFGEELQGNEDLESAVTVSTVHSNTHLSIVEKFNRNDETGSVNNDFGIFPYAIGRNVDGNIAATAIINELGVATTEITYPVSQLGRIAAVYVKGQGAISNNVAKSVTDVEFLAFPGVEGFGGNSSTLIASPGIIPGNTSVGISVCLRDSASNPLPGRFVNFSFVGPGQGSIDGISGAGTMPTATNFDGCAFGLADTTAIASGSEGAGFNFTSGNITCDLEESGNTNCIDVLASESGVLNANPSSFINQRGTVAIRLTLYDGSGNPIEGAPISGSCEQVDGGSLSIVSGPSLTNSSGQSSVGVSIALDAPEEPLSGTCTFAAASGEPSVDVHFTGGDSCTIGNDASPPPPPDNNCPVVVGP